MGECWCKATMRPSPNETEPLPSRSMVSNSMSTSSCAAPPLSLSAFHSQLAAAPLTAHRSPLTARGVHDQAPHTRWGTARGRGISRGPSRRGRARIAAPHPQKGRAGRPRTGEPNPRRGGSSASMVRDQLARLAFGSGVTDGRGLWGGNPLLPLCPKVWWEVGGLQGGIR